MLIRVAIVIGTLLLHLALPVIGEAWAACIAEQNIIWAAKSGGSFVSTAFGTQTYARLTNRSMDANCATDTQSGATALMWNNVTPLAHSEVGWFRVPSEFGDYVAFYEYSENGVLLGQGFPAYPCSKTAGNFDYWKVSYYFSDDDWVMLYACNPGDSWQELARFTNPTDDKGYPTVETMRFADAAGMSDEHHDLFWRVNSSTWTSWSDMGCRKDVVPGWEGYEVNNEGDHYHTRTGSGSCPAP